MLNKTFIQTILLTHYDQKKGMRRRYFTGDSEPIRKLKRAIEAFTLDDEIDISIVMDALFKSNSRYLPTQSATNHVFVTLLSHWLLTTQLNHNELSSLLNSLVKLYDLKLPAVTMLNLAKQFDKTIRAQNYSCDILIAVHILNSLSLISDSTLFGLRATKNPLHYAERCISLKLNLTIYQETMGVFLQLISSDLFSSDTVRQLCLHPEHELITGVLHSLKLENLTAESLNILLTNPLPVTFKRTLTLLLRRNSPLTQRIIKQLTIHRNPLEFATSYQILYHNEILPQEMQPIINEALLNTPYPAALLKITTHLFRLQLLNESNCELIATHPHIEYLPFIIDKLIISHCLHVPRLFKLSTHQREENQFILEKLLTPENQWLLSREARDEVWRQLPNDQLNFAHFNELLRRIGPPNTVIYYAQRLIEIDIEQRQRELEREALQREMFVHQRHAHVIHFFDLVRDREDIPEPQVLREEYNPKQSTHTTSVNESVSLSVNKLKKSYQHLIITSLQIQQTLNQCETIIKNSSLGTEFTRAAALRCFQRITKDLSYIHKPTQCSLIELLALVYHAMHDDEKRIGDFTDVESAFIEGLYEAQRQENISRGAPYNSMMYRDEPACANGVFNKLINLLHGHHYDCHIIYITPMTINEKLRCVVEAHVESYLQSLPAPLSLNEFNNRYALFDEITNPVHGIESLWPKIQNDVTKEMKDTFSGVEHQAFLEEIIPHAKDIVMPQNKIEPLKAAIKFQSIAPTQRLG